MPNDERRRAEQSGEDAQAIPFLKRFTVFNTDQCEELPDDIATAAPLPPPGLVEPRVEALIKASGIPFRIGGDKREVQRARYLHRSRHSQSNTAFLQENLGKSGGYYYWISCGIDDRAVRADRLRKSVGAENTFSSDMVDFDAMVGELRPLVDKVWRHCETAGNRGRTVTLKVKFSDFEIITRARCVSVPVSSRDELARIAIGLLHAEMPPPKSARLLGISLSSLQNEEDGTPQLDLPI